MNPRLYTTSYNKPQGQQFDTAVLSFIKLQYTEKSCKMINIFVLVTILGHLPVILFAKRKGWIKMIKKSFVFILTFMCLTLSACSNFKHVEEVSKWALSITCAEDSTEEAYVITYDDTVLISNTGTLAFQNQNDFDVVIYLLRDNQHEEKIEIGAGGAAFLYQIDQGVEYTLGCHADVKEGTVIKLMVYDGEETEVYTTE